MLDNFVSLSLNENRFVFLKELNNLDFTNKIQVSLKLTY